MIKYAQFQKKTGDCQLMLSYIVSFRPGFEVIYGARIVRITIAPNSLLFGQLSKTQVPLIELVTSIFHSVGWGSCPVNGRNLSIE